ncbi:MAG TPA: hypothetical protein VNR00_19715 [Opitutus sp.]|nr:hypothetical protein [Opitutus sp.]
MPRLRTAQELIHWLEMGAGARGIRLAAVLLGLLVLSGRVAWTQFHGATSETTLVQADVGRQLAAGEGFTTRVNYPQVAAFLETRGQRFDPARPYPELYYAPLYSLALGGALRLLPESARAALFASPAAPPAGFAADYFLLGLNVVLLWLTAWLAFDLARRLFDTRTAWLALLALFVSAGIWRQTVTLTGAPLPMLLAVAAFWFWARLDRALDAGDRRRAQLGCVALGAACGLLFLSEYAAGALVLVALGYAGWRGRFAAALLVAAGFAIVAGPWLARNLAVAGHPVALAAQNVTLKAGDPTAEPATVRNTLAAGAPAISLPKLGNKTLTALQQDVQSRLWSGGALVLLAFFVAGWLYAFRAPTANRLRWIFTLSLGVLLLAQAALNSGESERLASGWLAPLVIVFGAGFFFVLLGSNETLSRWPRLTAAVLLLAQALPLVRDVLEPPRLHFQYPPYFPSLFIGMREELQRRDRAERFGAMADVPAGVAWYGGLRVWSQPAKLRDFHAIALEQPIGELLLTPRTLDRPFFSELAARPLEPGALGAITNRFGDWGRVYAGLLTGVLPAEFPLRAPQKLADNLYVLLNPALPPPGEK